MNSAFAHCTDCGQVHDTQGQCPTVALEKAVQIVNQKTGELVDLNGSTDHLAEYLRDSKAIRAELRERERIVEAEILGRLDASASWTVHTSAGKVSAPSPAPVEEWDELALRSDLLGLVDEGLLSIEAVDRAIETCVSYKVRKAGVSALRNLGGRVAKVVEAHRTEREPVRSVRVSS